MKQQQQQKPALNLPWRVGYDDGSGRDTITTVARRGGAGINSDLPLNSVVQHRHTIGCGCCATRYDSLTREEQQRVDRELGYITVAVNMHDQFVDALERIAGGDLGHARGLASSLLDALHAAEAEVRP